MNAYELRGVCFTLTLRAEVRRYIDLIRHTFDFDSEDFKVENGFLSYYDVPLMELIEKYGTPLRLTYLPKISQNIQNSKKLFNQAIEKLNYEGSYTYCYCTKSSHFSFVVEQALKNDVQLETSSTFDIHIMRSLFNRGLISKDKTIVCNGFKPREYTKAISDLLNDGFKNCYPVLDNTAELAEYEEMVNTEFMVGLRAAADEEPDFDVYTSRLGIRYNEIIDFYKQRIAPNPKVSVKLMHFFIDSGIRDTVYFWTEFNRFVYKYCELKKICPTLDTLDIGGGFPIKNSLDFSFDYEYMAEQIVATIQDICAKSEVPVPNIFTEFGSYTVGESGAVIYSVIGEKQQNDKELWYLIDGSLITHLPDTWGTNHKFILLAINHWDNEYRQVNVGGITCDSMDYYANEAHNTKLMLPVLENKTDKLYLGFFNMGAYQESLSGYGGIHHCLIPNSQIILLDRDENGNLTSRRFAEEQKAESMLKVLGYI